MRCPCMRRTSEIADTFNPEALQFAIRGAQRGEVKHLDAQGCKTVVDLCAVQYHKPDTIFFPNAAAISRSACADMGDMVWPLKIT
jgi:hypothetical protein